MKKILIPGDEEFPQLTPDELLSAPQRGQALVAGTGFIGRLIVRYFENGVLIKEKDEGTGLVTSAGVNLIVADWTNTNATLKLANYHDTGTGSLAPATSDTVLQTPTGEARGTGSQSNLNNMYQTVGSVNFHSTFNITEWGLFTASSGVTLWDHKVFIPGYPVNNGSVLQFIYQLNAIAGG